MEKQELITENLILRKAKKDDLQFIWKNVWQDEEIAKNMLWKTTKTDEEAKIRLERTINYQQENYAYFVCLKSNNEPIGFAGVYEKENGIFEERGICIAQKCQGEVYGKEVVGALKKLIFEQLGGKRFIYSCFSTNEKSRRVCLSQGFKYFESREKVRDYDGMKFIVDYYFFDKEMYENNKMRKLNLIVVFNKNKEKVLFCMRAKPPYKGMYNFVGGKVEENESNDSAAYRELFEETGI